MIPPSRSRPLVCAEKIAACSPMLHSVHKTVDKLFDRLKNLTGQFVHSKPYNIFTPLTLGTDEPGWTFVRGYTNCPCAEHYLIKYKMASFSLVPRASVTFVQRMGQWSPSLYKRIATSGNEIGPLLAEIPRIHATTPLQYKNRKLNGYGVHTAPVKFATLYWLKNFELSYFSTARCLNFRTVKVVSSEHRNSRVFNVSERKLFQPCERHSLQILFLFTFFINFHFNHIVN